MIRKVEIYGGECFRWHITIALTAALLMSVPIAMLAADRSDSPMVANDSDSLNHPDKFARLASPNIRTDSSVTLDHHKYNLAESAGLTAFASEVKALQALSKDEKAEKKSEKKSEKTAAKSARKLVGSALSDIDSSDNKGSLPDAKPGSKERDWSSKKVKHGLKALEMITDAMRAGTLDSASAVHEIQEISWAVESNFIPQYVWRKSIDLGDLLVGTRRLLLNASGRGNAADPAWNLSAYNTADLSTVDPKPSAFWSRPDSIATKDLYTAYDRKVNPDFGDSICTYDSPHKGNGGHPSFEIDWHDSKWKVKFDEEQSSGPFASRVFWALGFPVDIYDFAPIVKVHWDKRILTSFNSRQPNTMQVKFARIPITTLKANKYYDPFNYIGYAVLKDGSQITPMQLRERCFTAAAGEALPARPELDNALYNKAFGDTIDYVVLRNASVTTKEQAEGVEEIGYWGYNCLDHAKLREVRGMAVLNAWLDNWDTRWANNRLYLVDTKGGVPQLKLVVSDLGALFGNSSGMVRRVHGKLKLNVYQNAPNDFSWSFTHPQAQGKTTVPIHDFMPDTKTEPFYEMNMDDARWMARLIAQLSEPQIKSALIGAGYEAPVARLILEKLVARRDQMLRDFGLSGEIKPLRATGADKRFSYDPQSDGPFVVTTASGERAAARNTGKYVVRNGFLITGPTPPAPPSRPLAQYSLEEPYQGPAAASLSQRP